MPHAMEIVKSVRLQARRSQEGFVQHTILTYFIWGLARLQLHAMEAKTGVLRHSLYTLCTRLTYTQGTWMYCFFSSN
jgi:hypothetical protein